MTGRAEDRAGLPHPGPARGLDPQGVAVVQGGGVPPGLPGRPAGLRPQLAPRVRAGNGQARRQVRGDQASRAQRPGVEHARRSQPGRQRLPKHQHTAQEFIRYFTGLENERRVLTDGSFPPVWTKLYDDPGLIKRFPYLPVLKRASSPPRRGRSARTKPAQPGDRQLGRQGAEPSLHRVRRRRRGLHEVRTARDHQHTVRQPCEKPEQQRSWPGSR